MAHILIVEDDKVTYEMYQRILENHGYQVRVATDGEQGLQSALNYHPDLILLDIRLPKMDGMAVLHALRKNDWGKTAKVIIVTNLDTDNQRLNQVIEDEPSFYLLKANNRPDMILEKVNEVLENNGA